MGDVHRVLRDPLPGDAEDRQRVAAQVRGELDASRSKLQAALAAGAAEGVIAAARSVHRLPRAQLRALDPALEAEAAALGGEAVYLTVDAEVTQAMGLPLPPSLPGRSKEARV